MVQLVLKQSPNSCKPRHVYRLLVKTDMMSAEFTAELMLAVNKKITIVVFYILIMVQRHVNFQHQTLYWRH